MDSVYPCISEYDMYIFGRNLLQVNYDFHFKNSEMNCNVHHLDYAILYLLIKNLHVTCVEIQKVSIIGALTLQVVYECCDQKVGSRTETKNMCFKRHWITCSKSIYYSRFNSQHFFWGGGTYIRTYEKKENLQFDVHFNSEICVERKYGPNLELLSILL